MYKITLDKGSAPFAVFYESLRNTGDKWHGNDRKYSECSLANLITHSFPNINVVLQIASEPDHAYIIYSEFAIHSTMWFIRDNSPFIMGKLS